MVLPQPDAPSRHDELAGPHPQVDAGQGGHGLGAACRRPCRRRAASSGRGGPSGGRSRHADGRGHLRVTDLSALSSPAASTGGLPAACSTAFSGVTSTNPARSVSLSVTPAVTLSLASCGNVAASGSVSSVMFGERAVDHRPAQRRVAGELLEARRSTTVLACAGSAVGERRSTSGARAAAPRRSPGTAAGTRCARSAPWSGTCRPATASPRPAAPSPRRQHQPRAPRLGQPAAVHLALLEQRRACAGCPGSHRDLVRARRRRSRPFSLEPLLERDVLRVALLRRGDDLALELLGRGDVGLDHELRAARGGARRSAGRPRRWTSRRR